MRVNYVVLGVLAGLVLVVCGLAAFGHELGMSHGALAWCQAVAAVIGGGVLSLLPTVVQAAEAQVEEAVKPSRPTRVPPSRESGHAMVDALLAVVMVGGAILAWLLHGCGASMTDAQRQAYADEVLRCERNEAAIVSRTGTTAEQDAHDLAAERARCDAARAAIEHPDGGQ